MEWKQALEGWNVLVAKQVLEWQAIAAVETRRADLVRLLEKRCQAPVPSDLAEAIQATEDMNLLLHWFEAALEANSFDDFRAATGWNLRVSQQVLEWQAEAEVKIRREDLLRVLVEYCQARVPPDLVEVIQATQDTNLLSRWFDVALDTNSFDDFRAAIQAQR
jgi:hypothetical protein